MSLFTGILLNIAHAKSNRAVHILGERGLRVGELLQRQYAVVLAVDIYPSGGKAFKSEMAR